MEMMAIEGYYSVYPAFYETALKVKYSSDDQTAKMFDLIREGQSFDLGRVYSTAVFDSMPGKIRGMITDNNTKWMSWYKSIEKVFTKKLDLFIETLS